MCLGRTTARTLVYSVKVLAQGFEGRRNQTRYTKREHTPTRNLGYVSARFTRADCELQQVLDSYRARLAQRDLA